MLVAGKQSPVPKRTTSATAAANKSRVGLTSTNTTSSTTNHRPVVTIKSPHASPGTRSAQTQQTTSTTTAATKNSSITSVPSTARRPVLQPKETHASRALAASRAAQQQKNSISTTTSAGNATARSGSATARSGSATARSGSNSGATARSGSATNRSTSVQSNSTKHVDPSAPFHRPNLASLHHSSRTAAKTSSATATTSRVPVQRMSSVGSNNSSSTAAANKRSSSTSSVNSNIGTGGRGGLGRSPSPVTIKSKRCKHCSTLVANLDKHMSECPCAPVECNFVDSEDRGSNKKNTSCGFIARGQKHLLEHQQHECPFRMIDCRNAELGCTDQVSAHSMDRHVAENCLFAVMLCEYCKNPVTRGHHEAHISTECPAVKVLCPLGCGRDIIRSELTAHIRDQWNDAAHPRTTRREAESGQPSGATRLMPPESARRVAETLISCLEAVNLQKESETILSPSDEVDSMPLGGDVNSCEHALFTGQSVLRSILRLQKYCESNDSNNGEFAQQTFELVERRTEVAKTRLEKFTSAENNKIASNLKSQLATSLGKVGVLVSSIGGGNEDQ